MTVCTRPPMRVSISASPDPSARPPARPPAQGVRAPTRLRGAARPARGGEGGVLARAWWWCIVGRCASTGKGMHCSLPEVAGVAQVCAQTKAREWGEGLPQAASAVAHAGRRPLHTTKARPHGAVYRLDEGQNHC